MTRKYTRRAYAKPSPTIAAEASPTIEREPARPEARADDPRSRARARAAELLNRGIPDGGAADQFEAPDSPDGWEYEWKAFTVINKENPSYQVKLANSGWEPVPASRHPEMMPTNYDGKTILLDGMVLMERPKEVSDFVRARDQKAAINQVRGNEARMKGQRTDGFDNAGASIKQSYGDPIKEGLSIPSD